MDVRSADLCSLGARCGHESPYTVGPNAHEPSTDVPINRAVVMVADILRAAAPLPSGYVSSHPSTSLALTRLRKDAKQLLSQTQVSISLSAPQVALGLSIAVRSHLVTTSPCPSKRQLHEEEEPRSQWPVHT